MRVLAFDPGYGRTGWGVVEQGQHALGAFRTAELRGVAYGVIETPAGHGMARRLRALHEAALEILREHTPDHVVMERLFFSKSTTTAAGVYQAQGALLVAVGQGGRELIELGPNTIKQVLTGSGRASKAEITRMVERLLGFPGPIRPDDAADALAGAVAGIYHARSQSLVSAAQKGGVSR